MDNEEFQAYPIDFMAPFSTTDSYTIKETDVTKRKRQTADQTPTLRKATFALFPFAICFLQYTIWTLLLFSDTRPLCIGTFLQYFARFSPTCTFGKLATFGNNFCSFARCFYRTFSAYFRTSFLLSAFAICGREEHGE